MPYPDSEYPSILRGRTKRESQRLLAAAPEMLAALKAAISILSGWDATSRLDAGDTETVRLCKKALAKAEGSE